MKKYDIAIIGGDKRTACMASVFVKQGYNVICFGTLETSGHNTIHHAATLKEAISKAPIIICGIPLEKNGYLYFENELPKIPLTELQRLLKKQHKLFGGIIPPDFKSICEKRQIDCYDFMQEEPLTIFNAIATAEGAILEALLHKPTQLHQSKTLVLGYGRCGKVLADKLKGLSAHVTVCSAQANELATAAAFGFQTMHLSELPQTISDFEYLFNTIPATVLTKSCLEKLEQNTLIIDIASNRIGVDYEVAALLKRNVYYCPGLPGKYASLSCAEQLAEYVFKKL
uniref:dipicolinate synthase subunit DpsA n=1 Tax=Acetatifactor sp. TaxID=1872090 RepID=UPI004057831A